MTLEKIKENAELLYTIRKEIAAIEEEAKAKMEAMKVRRDEIQNELIALMTSAGLSSIKVSSGENYAKATRKGIAIVSEPHALVWAKENNAYAIDKRLVEQKLKNAEVLPPCFARTETQFISVRKPTIKKEVTE